MEKTLVLAYGGDLPDGFAGAFGCSDKRIWNFS